jgi:hypothetical protein
MPVQYLIYYNQWKYEIISTHASVSNYTVYTEYCTRSSHEF